MTGEKRPVDLLVFYLISFVALVVSGLIYKILFVVYNDVQFSSLAISEISYALIWGVRFDIASAGLLSLLGCLLLWVFYRPIIEHQPATAAGEEARLSGKFALGDEILIELRVNLPSLKTAVRFTDIDSSYGYSLG